MEQRSREWHIERRGKITASNFHKLAGARGIGVTGQRYIETLVAGMLGVEEPEISGPAIQWGVDLENDAREYYSLSTDMEVSEIGFVNHKTLAAGCSPDGLVAILTTKGGVRAGIEIKCPYNPSNHVRHMMVTGADSLLEAESKYYWQVMFSLWVTGWDYWHFVSYDPRFTGEERMHIAKITLPEKVGEFIETRVKEALKERDRIMDKIKSLRKIKP